MKGLSLNSYNRLGKAPIVLVETSIEVTEQRDTHPSTTGQSNFVLHLKETEHCSIADLANLLRQSLVFFFKKSNNKS